jgi:site-specific recombinase XerD
VPTRAGAESFPSLFQAYLADISERGLSESLRERAEYVLPLLFVRGTRSRDVRSVREPELVAFALRLSRMRNARTRRHLLLATQRLYLQAVRRFFAFLLKCHVILDDPARDLPCRRTDALPRRVLSEAQARRLMQAPSPYDVLGRRDRAILELLYGTGIRRGECQRLDVTDVDLGQQLVFIRNGKGKKDRMVPVSGRAVVALDLYLGEGRPELVRDARETALFLSMRGRRLDLTRIDRLVAQHAREAGISGRISPHVLRHSYATHLLAGKASVRHVQQLLGHGSIETTAVYTRVGVQDLREVLLRCHPRERCWRRAHRSSGL